MQNFKDFGLCEPLLNQLEKIEYTFPTLIQAQSIPLLLEKRDLLAIAQTGTGKTAAFALPILNQIENKPFKLNANHIRVLVLSPTRELASQIEESFITYGAGIKFTSKVVFGGVSKGPQVDALNLGVEVLIATPGRLLDLIQDRHILFNQLEFLVLDEADNMLDMGFMDDVKKIISLLPTKRQTALFSATMPIEIEKLAKTVLSDYLKIEITPETSTVEKIDQKVCFIDKRDKVYFLLSLLENESYKSVLIFCKTKFTVDRVVEQLERALVTTAALHSGKTQGARESALNSFKKGEIRTLVATDLAARGIDVTKVSLIVNMNLPEDPRNYIHRIGRTARAGESGVSISLCVESELPLLKNVEKHIGQSIPTDINHSFHKEFSKDSELAKAAQKKKKDKKKFSKKRKKR